MPGAIIVVPCYNEEKRLPAEAILAFARIAHLGGVKFLMVTMAARMARWRCCVRSAMRSRL